MTTETANLIARLVDRLGEVSMGELVTLDHLSAAIGQNVKQVRYLIYRALDAIEKQSGAKFKTVYNVGYQRLKNDELIKIGQTARRRVRGVAKRANKGMDAAMRVANDLTPEQTNALLREQSSLGLIEHFSRDKNLPKIDMTEKRPLTPGQATRQFLEDVGGV